MSITGKVGAARDQRNALLIRDIRSCRVIGGLVGDVFES